MENDPKILLLALTLAPGTGPAGIKALVGAHPTITNILNLERKELEAISGIGHDQAETLSRFIHENRRDKGLAAALEKAERELDRIESLGARMLTLLEDDYPPLLREIHDPPACLFLMGTLAPHATLTVSVVGTSYMSHYGRQAAEYFSRSLGRQGVTICSGLDPGIGVTALASAIDAGGATLAVLASGIDRRGGDPKGELQGRILEKGALIAESWTGTNLTAEGFTRRQRIIAGIASGTLLIEADMREDPLMTAAAALEENREVFALPGNIFMKGSRGPNMLIREGRAKAVTHSGDILQELVPPHLMPAPFSQDGSAILAATLHTGR